MQKYISKHEATSPICSLETADDVAKLQPRLTSLRRRSINTSRSSVFTTDSPLSPSVPPLNFFDHTTLDGPPIVYLSTPNTSTTPVSPETNNQSSDDTPLNLSLPNTRPYSPSIISMNNYALAFSFSKLSTRFINHGDKHSILFQKLSTSVMAGLPVGYIFNCIPYAAIIVSYMLLSTNTKYWTPLNRHGLNYPQKTDRYSTNSRRSPEATIYIQPQLRHTHSHLQVSHTGVLVI